MTRRRGLSLIEVVLVMVILGLAVPPLLIQISVGTKQQTAAFVQQNLTQLASERLWEISVDHANPTRGYGAITPAAYPDENAPRGLKGYARRTEVREVSPADYVTPQPGSGIKRFRVRVTGPGNLSLVVESIVTDIPGALAG